jgi:hypothetical protein
VGGRKGCEAKGGAGELMAVVKGNYIRRGKAGNPRAKDAIRYMQHRPEREGERVTRVLFGPDGRWERVHGYQMIDEASPGTHFYRMSINPDPKGEDHHRDLDLRAVTERTIHSLAGIVAKPVLYVAAVHEEHADSRRHVYLVASVPRRLNTPEIEGLRDAATQVCLEQRQERDREARESTTWEREPEEDAWGF